MPKLTDLSTIRDLCARYDFALSKGFGQNFIINPGICPRIAEASGIGPGWGALEVGPGIGVLTEQLCKRADNVVSIEVDKRLPPLLEETMADYDNFKLILNDVLKVDLKALLAEEFGGKPVAVCANLPYYFTSPILMRLLEEKRPVDLILFCDTGLEFPQMYEHLARLEAYIGRPITRLKAEHDFEYYFLHYTPKRKNPALEQYSGMSWAGPRNRWCTGILKTRVVDAYLKELREDYTVIEYVGIAADEPKRIKDKTYPLAEWGMTEKDCLAYCYERGFDWGGLYEIFHRVSCWCCPLQSLDELRKLHRHFPDLWRQLETWDDATWRTFIKGYSARDLATRFDFEKQWQKAGGNIRSRAFYAAMREEIQRCRTEVKPCLTSRREMWSRER